MEELVKLVVKKAGISEEQAGAAIDTVVAFLKENPPAPLSGQIDGFIAGGDAAKGAGALLDNLGGLGSLLGKKK